MMLRINLILTFWLIIKLIHPYVDKLSVMSSYILPGILGSMTIEKQSAESMNTNHGDVQSFPDQKLHTNRCTTRIETQSSESMNA